MVHEEIRRLSHEAGSRVKIEGLENDLVERIRNCDFFAPIHGEIDQLLNPISFIGRAPQQVTNWN